MADELKFHLSKMPTASDATLEACSALAQNSRTSHALLKMSWTVPI